MELSSGFLSRGEYLRVVELLTVAGIFEVLVAYGFGCDCRDDLLFQDVLIASADLPAFIANAEAAGYYQIGRDNLHVKAPDGRGEFLFCHESDIHLTTDDVGLLGQLRSAWLGDGYRRIFERNGGGWQEVSPPAATDDPSG